VEEIKQLASQLGCEGQVKHLDYVDQRFFPGLYAGAACLVFPSLFEGFGIPLVEAMACGCSVVCSDTCSMPEVVGDAAVLFDPRNPDLIADALEQLLRNESLRQQLIAKGLRRASLFSWRKTAEQTLEVFEAVRRQGKVRSAAYVPPQEAVEGFLADGWAGPRMLVRRVELSRWRKLILEGEISGNCCPLTIQVQGGRELIDKFETANPGAFSREIELPQRTVQSPLIDLQISADRHFVPQKIGLNKDTRRLSYQLRKLVLVDGEGNTMSFHGTQ
jgi:hypothetical protein